MSSTISRGRMLEEVQNLTAEVFSELKSKWMTMYKCDEEFLEKREEKFIDYLRMFYNDILQSEESKRREMIDKVEKKICEYRKLLKDLQLTDVPWTLFDREPYTAYLEQMENSMKKYEEMKEKRLEKYQSLRSVEKELCDLLEISPLPDFPNAIPCDQELDEIESHIFNLREEKVNRLEYFIETKRRIIDLMTEMDYDAEKEFELDAISCDEKTFIPSTSKVNMLKDLLRTLESEYELKLEYRRSLVDKLLKLWDRIKVEEGERESFLSRWPGVTKSHIKALNDEIARCEEIKLANIKPIVEQVREHIIRLWNLLTYSEGQRKTFKAFFTDHFSEDILDLHELELENLTEFYQKYQYIFELADKRDKLWQRMNHLEEISMDKARLFNNRGGQLLKEEKERKSLEINLPKVDKQLKNALVEFQRIEDRPFLWYGGDLLEKITQDWEKRNEAKESKKLTRKQQIESEAKLSAQKAVQKRKMEFSSAEGGAKMRREDLGQTIVLQGGGVRTPRRLPRIRTPLNVSTASIASYSHFQDGLEKSEISGATPRSALKEVGNSRTPGIGHSSPTLLTPAGRSGTPVSVVRSGGRTFSRMAPHRARHLKF